MDKEFNAEILMGYLYDELKDKDRAHVEEYLKSNPEAQKEMDEMKLLRNNMAKVDDREVLEPFLLMGSNSGSRNMNQSRGWWRSPWMAVAASIVLVMLAGYFTKVQLSFGDTTIGFGPSIPETGHVEQGVSKEQFLELKNELAESLNENNRVLLEKIGRSDSLLASQMLATNTLKGKVDALPKSNNLDEGLISGFVEQLRKENIQTIQTMYHLSKQDQQREVELLLASFAQFLEGQRSEDMKAIETTLSVLSQSTYQSRLETDEILASIITTVNNQNRIGQ